MNQAKAHERIRKLREMRVDRGASPAEAKTAQLKAARLERKYGKAGRASAAGPRTRATPRASAEPFAPFVAPQTGGGVFRVPMPDWSFDPMTGKHSDNVKVHYHESRGKWKIEIDP